MTQKSLTAIILAAGKGTRMKSDMPKVLHSIAGLSMLGHVMKLCNDLNVSKTIVITGHGKEQVEREALKLNPQAIILEQKEQLGTGHAVLCASEILKDSSNDVIILYGDTPLITAETIRQMQIIRNQHGADNVFLGFESRNPSGYGRLIVDEKDGELVDIIEAKEATPDQLKINLCNSGVILARSSVLLTLLHQIDNKNSKGEYYLTDIVKIGRSHNFKTFIGLCDEDEVIGVNSKVELSHAELIFQTRKRLEMMVNGVTLHMPQSVYFSHDTQIASDTIIEPNVVFGVGVSIEKGNHIRAFSYLEKCFIEEDSVIGPYARIRPETSIGKGCHIGNFVEVKKSIIEKNSKINHLSYIGDSLIGQGVNIGAGTITCNYDGVSKHRTIIQDGAFIGSNSALVAPVTIGKKAYVGSGSVITQDVPEGKLAIARGRQVNLEKKNR